VSDSEYDLLVPPYVPDGLIGSPADLDLVFGDSSGRVARIRPNRYGLARGRLWSSGSSTFNLTIAANGSGSIRYDLVVLRYTRASFHVRAFVVQGVAGSGIPSPVNDASYYDVPVATVQVDPGVPVIAAGKVVMVAWYAGPQTLVCESDHRPPHARGLIIFETDTDAVRISTGSAWKNIYQDTDWVSRSPASGFTDPAGGYGIKFRAVNAHATMFAEVQRAGALAGNSRAVFVTFDAQYAPSVRLPVDLWVASDSGELTVVSNKVTVPNPRINAAIQTNGTITLDAHPAIDSGALIIMPTVTWPIG
jgi:hypothetical protein